MNRPRDINAPSPWNMRIWDVENNEWLGQSDPDGATFYGFDIRGGETTVFSNMNGLYNQIAHGRELIWERSTGFKDRKGEEIYEGDIVENGARDSVVTWHNWLAVFCFDSEPIYKAASINEGYSLPNWSVIGNIHENPELLSNDLTEK